MIKPTKKFFSDKKLIFIDEALDYICEKYKIKRYDAVLRGFFKPLNGENLYLDMSYDYCIKVYSNEEFSRIYLYPLSDINAFVLKKNSNKQNVPLESPDYLLYLEISYLLYIEFSEHIDEFGILTFWTFKEDY